MNLFRYISKWSWLVLLPPVFFSAYCYYLITEVNTLQEQVDNNVYTITLLSSLERSFEKFSEVWDYDNDPAGALAYWDSLDADFQKRMSRIPWNSPYTPGLDSFNVPIAASKADLDSLARPLFAGNILSEENHKAGAFVQIHTHAAGLIRGAKFKARVALSDISENLQFNWNALTAMIWLLCLVTFLFKFDLIWSHAKTNRLREVEQALTNSRDYFRRVFQQAGVGICMIDVNSGAVVRANPAFCEMLGYTENEVARKNFVDLSLPREQKNLKAFFQEIIGGGQDGRRLESRLITYHGKVVWTSVSAALLLDIHQKPEFCLAIVEDISARVSFQEALQESQERYRMLADTSSDMITRHSQQGDFIYVSPACQGILGYDPHQMVARNVRDIIHPDDLPDLLNYWREVLGEEKKRTPFEFRAYRQDGQVVWLEAMAKQVTQPDGQNSRETIAVSRDITARKEAELALARAHEELESRVEERTARLEILNRSLREEISQRIEAEELLEKTLREKELLLREIFHRVKNNMQVISSLMQLQEEESRDPVVRNTLKESRDRLSAMALLHEGLYQAKDLSTVDLGQYFGNLIRFLQNSYLLSGSDRVMLGSEIEPVNLKIDSAIPLGLVVNELIANAFKYAFPADRSFPERPEIFVRFGKEPLGDNYRLVVKDNGVGLPQNLDIRNAKSFGLKLVNLLARQLNGTLAVTSEGGTEISLTLPESPYKERVNYGGKENPHR